MSALPSPPLVLSLPAAPPVTNGRVASALLALAAAEDPVSRRAAAYRAAARTLRTHAVELHGRRVALSSLPGVSPRAADAIASFLACGSDENVGDALAAMLDHVDPGAHRKADFLSRADVDRILRRPTGISHADLRGDAHLHTDRSDGRMPLAALHRALEARGDTYAVLTDHARDCAVAGGLFPADFRAQRREVDALNAPRRDLRDVRRSRGEHRRGRFARRDTAERPGARRRRRLRPYGPEERARPDGAARARRRDSRRRRSRPPEGPPLRHAKRRARRLAAGLRGRRGTRRGHRAERLPGPPRPAARARARSPFPRAAAFPSRATRTRPRTSRSSTTASPSHASRESPRSAS